MATQHPRAPKRRQTNKVGVLKINDKEVTVLMRDASATGARVRLVTSSDVPQHVRLVSAMEKIDVACSVVWRRGNDLGLRFEN